MLDQNISGLIDICRYNINAWLFDFILQYFCLIFSSILLLLIGAGFTHSFHLIRYSYLNICLT